MEVGDVVQFEERGYLVKRKFFRSRGGRNQQLSETPPPRVETRRTFYVVEDEQGKRFWVKEFTDPTFGDTPQSEYAEATKLATLTVYEGHDIRAVRVLALSKSRILMELLQGYEPLTHLNLSQEAKTLVRVLLEAWIQEHPGTDISHDFGPPNVLVKQGATVSVRLVDFEVSPGYDNRKRWRGFLEGFLG